MKQIIAALLCLSFTGCAGFSTKVSTWWSAHKTQVGQTGVQVAKDLATFAAQTLIAAAQSPQDANHKADIADELAYGFRTVDKADLVSADKLKAYLAIWTPDATHWNTIASQAASAALSGGPSQQRLEAIASALNDAATQVRATSVP